MSTARIPFLTCVREAWLLPEFMREYRRLTGTALGLDARTGIERMIDDATGNVPVPKELRHWLCCVRDLVWAHMPGEPTPDDVATVLLLCGPKEPK